MTIFQSSEAKANLNKWHERFRQKIGVPTESRRFLTRFGETHALLCGPEDGPAIVCLHGALSSSAHVLAEAAPLVKRFRLIAPDVIGQSPMSAEVRPDVNSPAYGEWLLDVFDGLQLQQANVLGVSWGGLVALRAAKVMPTRINKLTLLVPAGIVQGSAAEAFFKIALPMMLYRTFPSEARLNRFVRDLITTHDADWVHYLGDAMRGFKLDFKLPRLLKDGDLNNFQAPVQVIGAEGDIQFPGQQLLDRAKVVIPNVVDTRLIPDCHHAPPFTDEFRNWFAGHVERFINFNTQCQ